MPNHLLLAFERGYNALPGVIAQDIVSWGDMKQVCRELKKPEVKERFSSIIVDTVDLAADLCQKYVCNQLGIDNIGDGGWTNNGWSKYKKEFEETFRSLTMMGYAVVFIAHSKETAVKDKAGKEYTSIKPSTQSSALSIIENMADIYGYAHVAYDEKTNTNKPVLTLRPSGNESIFCGGRFKYLPNEVDFTYEALSKALIEAIDKEAAATKGVYTTDKRETTPIAKEYDYDALREEFENLTGDLMSKDANYYAPRVVQIVDKYLGKGKKVGDTTREQGEFIFLINSEIKEELLSE